MALGSDSSYGNNGFFVIPHNRIVCYFFNCQVSDGMEWEHVSITLTKEEIIFIGNGRHTKKIRIKAVERCATWEEMCYVKSLFWEDEQEVMQLHPPKSSWINNHPFCLHLWRPTKENIPLPLQIMVGVKELNKTENQTV